jgi:membrane-bound metal-dependent hydrolase YbcI (DUF457 family)
MANRKLHAILGASAAVGFYVFYTQIKEEGMSLPELLGFTLFGTVGAFLPDVIEPATSPNHRSFFHSLSFAGVAGPPAWLWAWRIRNEQIRFAKECEMCAAVTMDEHEKSSFRWRALWHRFLAGLLPGLVIGYASHLVADAVTPKGLPFLR